MIYNLLLRPALLVDTKILTTCFSAANLRFYLFIYLRIYKTQAVAKHDHWLYRGSSLEMSSKSTLIYTYSSESSGGVADTVSRQLSEKKKKKRFQKTPSHHGCRYMFILSTRILQIQEHMQLHTC